jgi:hypothetical protein
MGGFLRLSICGHMLLCRELFDYAYNRISDTMPAFITELDKIWPDGIEDTKGETPSD